MIEVVNAMRLPSQSWWRHQMETCSALLAICAGNSPVPGEFPAQRPVTRSFDVFFDLRLNNRLSKQSWGWWFETLSRPLWRYCNECSNKANNHTPTNDLPRYNRVGDNQMVHWHEYKSIVYELLKLEMSDYTVDRDNPFSVTGKLPHAKICLRILQDRDDQVDLGI